MKKILIFLALFAVNVLARNPIELSVVGVAPNDTLNVRKSASHKSRIITKLAPFAKGFYTNKALPRNPSSWVPISVQHAGTTVRGWVKRRYVTRHGEYYGIQSTHLSLRYPSFMQTHKNRDDTIEISYAIKAKHYDGCDMRDEPEVLMRYPLLSLTFAVHDTLKDVLKKLFKDYYKNGIFDKELRYDEQADWFKKPNKNDWVEELDFHGKHTRRIMIGAEGCGVNYYFYKQSGKVILITEPYNSNPPVDPQTNRVLSGSWKLPDRDALIGTIIKSIKIHR